MFLDIMLLYAWQKEIESKYIILLHSLIPCFLATSREAFEKVEILGSCLNKELILAMLTKAIIHMVFDMTDKATDVNYFH